MITFSLRLRKYYDTVHQATEFAISVLRIRTVHPIRRLLVSLFSLYRFAHLALDWHVGSR